MNDTDTARAAWDALITETGVAMEVATPNGFVEGDWIAVAFPCVLTRGTAMHTIVYKMGIGCVDWKKAQKFPALYCGYDPDRESMVNLMANRPSARPRDKNACAMVAASIAIRQKVKPKIADVLWSLFMDGRGYFDGQTFEDWCADFGYDTDSRKAEATFNECRATGAALIRLFGLDICKKFLALESL